MFRIFKGSEIKVEIAGAHKEDPEKLSYVSAIIERVRQNGDRALLEYTEQFDNTKLSAQQLQLSAADLKAAYKQVDAKFISAVRLAIKNITAFHKREKPKGFKLGNLALRSVPIEKVGLYVPGGKAKYPSSVLMNAVPAKIAGVSRLVMVSPPPIDPQVLVAAAEAGIQEVFQIGGAQAVAALAFGTETIPAVDKIVGPGNVFVSLAKKLLFGQVGIDSLAGPSDVLILADEKTDPRYIAADMLAQLEHDPEASAILVTTSEKIAQEVNLEASRQLEGLKRKAIIVQSAQKNGKIYVAENLKQAIEISNIIAPEHLEIQGKNPKKILPQIKNAGAIFVGAYSPVALGDYIAGTNHVLPTAGTARFSSPLGVYDFIKWQSVVEYSKADLSKLSKQVEVWAQAEKLDGHARSVSIRSA